MKLGELIAVAREVKGLTLRELERKTGISNALLSQIETGKVRDTSFGNAIRLSQALGLPLERMAKCYMSLDDFKAILRR